MPTISVLTAAYGPTARYLPATMDSVADQLLPDGWSLEWIIQEDGPEPRLGNQVARLPFVSYSANAAQLGLATTRNIALSRARGDLVQILDHDDILLPGALATLIPLFEQHDIHWALGQADDLMPDGTRKAYPPALPFGIIQPGAVNEWAIEHGGNWPLHCAGLMLRTVSVRAIGGWAGSPADDDLAMFAALSEVGPGYHSGDFTWLYRQHPDQTTKTAFWRERSGIGRTISLQRALSVRALRMQFGADTSLDYELTNTARVELAPAIKEQQAKSDEGVSR